MKTRLKTARTNSLRLIRSLSTQLLKRNLLLQRPKERTVLMTSTTCNNMNELLRRFAYRTPDKPKAMDKQMSVALLARLYGGVDLEQLVRCGLFTFPAACTAMNRLSGSRKNVLRRTKLLDGSQSVYAARNCGKSLLICLPMLPLLRCALTNYIVQTSEWLSPCRIWSGFARCSDRS